MEEAEGLCDHLAIIDHGRVIAQGTLGELRAILGERDLLRLNGSFPADAAKALAGIQDLEVVQASSDQMTLSLRDASRRLPAVFTAVAGARGEVRETTLTQPSLETLFIKLTGKEMRE
jgi:ABC-2 type transport system ATP-binding protein